MVRIKFTESAVKTLSQLGIAVPESMPIEDFLSAIHVITSAEAEEDEDIDGEVAGDDEEVAGEVGDDAVEGIGVKEEVPVKKIRKPRTQKPKVE